MNKRTLACWWGDFHVADITAKRPWDLRLRYAHVADRGRGKYENGGGRSLQ
ncbi:MAG: hypothetical protein WC184_02040 [Acidimicrobiia bacterium]